MLARFKGDALSTSFASGKKLKIYSQKGPLTPDHVIRTKRIPAIIEFIYFRHQSVFQSIQEYFDKHDKNNLTCLDSAPRWAILERVGTLSFGKSVKELP